MTPPAGGGLAGDLWYQVPLKKMHRSWREPVPLPATAAVASRTKRGWVAALSSKALAP